MNSWILGFFIQTISTSYFATSTHRVSRITVTLI